jgi:hypothetical protein
VFLIPERLKQDSLGQSERAISSERRPRHCFCFALAGRWCNRPWKPRATLKRSAYFALPWANLLKPFRLYPDSQTQHFLCKQKDAGSALGKVSAILREPSGFGCVEEPEGLRPFRYNIVCKLILKMRWKN